MHKHTHTHTPSRGTFVHGADNSSFCSISWISAQLLTAAHCIYRNFSKSPPNPITLAGWNAFVTCTGSGWSSGIQHAPDWTAPHNEGGQILFWKMPQHFTSQPVGTTNWTKTNSRSRRSRERALLWWFSLSPLTSSSKRQKQQIFFRVSMICWTYTSTHMCARNRNLELGAQSVTCGAFFFGKLETTSWRTSNWMFETMNGKCCFLI